MKGITFLALASVLVVGCSKGTDEGVTSETAPAGKSTPSTTSSSSSGSGAYTFNFSPHLGKTTYKIDMTMDMGAGKPMSMPSTMTTDLSKNPDGTFTAVVNQGSTGGQIKVTEIIDSKGNVLKSTVSGPNGMNQTSGGRTMSIAGLFPDHSVNIGDTWTKTQKIGDKNSMVTTYKLTKVDGDIATLETNGKMDNPKVTSTGTITIEMSTGAPHSIISDSDSTIPTKGGNRELKMHMDMERQ